MRDIEYIEKAVQAYCERHGHTAKITTRYQDEPYYSIVTMNYTELEAKIAKNGRVVFKVDGKVTSLYK